MATQKNISCIEQRFGQNVGEKNFAQIRFSWNSLHVYVNANVLIQKIWSFYIKLDLLIYDFYDLYIIHNI